MKPWTGPRIDVVERFWSKVQRSDGCWIWIGPTGRGGYGVFSPMTGKNVRAHRYSYELERGEIGPGLLVIHSCDNPPCVNPAHLRAGTAKDNSRDMVMRGRSLVGDRNPSRAHPEKQVRGERQHKAKLTEEKVRMARALEAGGLRRADIARAIGVSRAASDAALEFRTWKHVTGNDGNS